MVTAARLALLTALAFGTVSAGEALSEAGTPSARSKRAKKKKKKKKASARPSVSARRARAEAAFEKASALFEADEFEGALIYFVEAYEYSDRRPSTILALAQCERILKRYDDALVHYREYLATGLSEEESLKVRQTIQVVENLKAIEQREAAAAEPPPVATVEAPQKEEEVAAAAIAAPPPPVEEEGGVLESPVFWIVLGGVFVAGGAAAGIALGVRGGEDPYGGTKGVLADPDLR